MVPEDLDPSRKAGTSALGGGLFMAGVQDTSGNPVAIDVTDDMFSVSLGQSAVVSNNSLLVNLNKNGGLTALGITTTTLFAAALGQLSMEYLDNQQEDLAAHGYHDRDWLVEGKFSITVELHRRGLHCQPCPHADVSTSDFSKGGAFYAYGVTAGCGDWLFKEDKAQMRFRFRGDLDGSPFGRRPCRCGLGSNRCGRTSISRPHTDSSRFIRPIGKTLRSGCITATTAMRARFTSPILRRSMTK